MDGMNDNKRIDDNGHLKNEGLGIFIVPNTGPFCYRVTNEVFPGDLVPLFIE